MIDGAREQAVLRWPGGLSATQLVKLLDDGERAVRGDAQGKLARADRLNAEGKMKEAAVVYRAALPRLPADTRPRAVVSLLAALQMAHNTASCALAGKELVPTIPRGPAFANAAAFALGCAAELKGEERASVLAKLVPLAEEALKLPGLLADDRSALFETLVDLRAQAGDNGGKRALALRWLEFLDHEAGRATGAEQRAAFDTGRVSVALAMGEPLRAEAALMQSERDLPADYNPPAWLAFIYHAAGRQDDALAAVDRALAKGYGPRSLQLYDLKADTQIARGEGAGARRTLEKALRVARAFPVEQGRDRFVASFEKKLRGTPAHDGHPASAP